MDNTGELAVPFRSCGAAVASWVTRPDVAKAVAERRVWTILIEELESAVSGGDFRAFTAPRRDRSDWLLAVRREIRRLGLEIRAFLEQSFVPYSIRQIASTQRDFFLRHGAHPPRLYSLLPFINQPEV